MYIEIKNLNFQYPNAGVKTIDNLSLDINEGEIISILGPSGSGKSTVLRLIAGLEKPSGGVIKINNQVVFDAQAYVFPEDRGVGMVFQDYALFPHMTVEKNIKYGLKKHTKQQKNQRVAEVLALVNLQDFKKRYPHELSGGQQQRVSLARAIAPQPAVLLLDEPFSNLDADLQQNIRDELKKILKQAGITAIFVTHDQEDADALADRIVYLEN
ncbi:ABC transporter ATP-binding protein [Desulfolucanica intricata]|uniref:ABC transporter ATP-binding protein n=1 Tax=Desulfolucanica intricata TaxID=1285191 RepID=UPI00082B3CC3|nr:ABC transporter ATP-binding protein [Desulfolucanica intricata]